MQNINTFHPGPEPIQKQSSLRQSIETLLKNDLPKELLRHLDHCKNANEVRLAVRNFCEINGYALHPDSVHDSRMSIGTDQLMQIAALHPMPWQKQLPAAHGHPSEGSERIGITSIPGEKNIYAFAQTKDGRWHPFTYIARSYGAEAPGYERTGHGWKKID